MDLNLAIRFLLEELASHKTPAEIHARTDSSWTFVESDITSFALSSSELVIRMCSLCWLLFGCTALFFQIGWEK
jgi:hypothetical protein